MMDATLRLVAAGLMAIAMIGTPVLAADEGDGHSHDGGPMMTGGELTGPAAQVMAKVGDVEITLGHMIAMTATLSDEFRAWPTDELFEGVLERLIQQEALMQSAEELSVLTRLQMENERRSLVASVIVEGVSNSVLVTEENIQMAYDRRFSNFTPGREFNASHILLDTEEDANAVMGQLSSGADFAEMAREHSTGPTGPNGGSLGWFGQGMMVPEFEQAVQKMEVGQMVGPVQTKFGWHLIKLNEVRQPGKPTMEDLRNELTAEMHQENFRNALAEIIDRADITRMIPDGIDMEAMRDMSLISN